MSEEVRRSGIPAGLLGTTFGTVVGVVFRLFRGTVVLVLLPDGPPLFPLFVEVPESVVFVMTAVPSKGLEVSTRNSSDWDVVDVFPLVSVTVAVTDHAPSASAGRSQPVVAGAAT